MLIRGATLHQSTKMRQSVSMTSTHWGQSTPHRKNIMNLNELAMFISPVGNTHPIESPTKKRRLRRSQPISKSELLQSYLLVKEKLQVKPIRHLQMTRSLSTKQLATELPKQCIAIEHLPTVTNRVCITPMAKPTAAQKIDKQIITLADNLVTNPNYRYLVKEVSIRNKININYKALYRQLITRMHLIRRLNLDASAKIFCNKPFQKPLAYEFIHACKSGDVFLVEELLKKDPYLVFAFDYIHLTGLHWAVKRNHMRVVKYLIDYGVDVDAYDLIGRPALYFAVETCNIEAIKLLLEDLAKPWTPQPITYSKLCKDNLTVMLLLNKSRKYHVLINLVHASLRCVLLQKKLVGAFDI